MPTDAVLVIDAGTSALRAVRVQPAGDVTTMASVPWRMFTPDDGSSFARELDGREVADALRVILRAAEGDEVACVALTGQREGVVFLDHAGEALLVSPNVDGRAALEGMAFDRAHGEQLYAITGHLPALMQAPAKLAWLRAERPESAGRVRAIVPLADWLGELLTGERGVSRTLAAENGLIDINAGGVARDLLAALAVSSDLVPTVVDDGAVIGRVRAGALAGSPVVLAGADTQCALAGMGCIDEGTGVVAGWSAPVQTVTPAPAIDEQRHTWAGLHVRSGRWVLESNAGECGRGWEWLRTIMALSHDDAERIASASPPGARDALALLGPREMQAGGMTVGTGALTFPLPLIMSTPERSDILRSALEAIAFTVRANVEQLEAVSGMTIDRLALGGGMSRSALFRRVVCDATGRRTDVAASPETSALGAAVVASPALGLHDTIEQAASALGSGMRTLQVDAKTSAVYDDCYVRWRELAMTFEQEKP